ncbi:hypothetical protein TNCV_2490061 [Trichonephila clavipes]|nr:hypothetical protein TNCV_2490061 [Trichonephila clavipes]
MLSDKMAANRDFSLSYRSNPASGVLNPTTSAEYRIDGFMTVIWNFMLDLNCPNTSIREDRNGTRMVLMFRGTTLRGLRQEFWVVC